MSKEKILIIDDEKPINKLACSYVAKEHFVPFPAYNGQEALEILRKENPDLIILDIMLPDTDGTDLCLEIRKYSNAPVIFLSCKTREIDKIIALSAGGDDYITKPFLPGELVARIKAHLRRQNILSAENAKLDEYHCYETEQFTVDFDAYELLVQGNPVSATNKEFEILKLLMEHPRKIFSSQQIFETIWKTACIGNDAKTVTVYISTLRKKIEPNPERPSYIISVKGVGYKFNHSLLK